MKHILLSVTPIMLSIAAAFSPVMAQEREAPTRPNTPVTLRGCLVKGAQAQMYNILDEKSGENITFAGSDKFDGYVNQTVEIDGRIVDKGAARIFEAQSVKSVASTCAKK